MAQSQHPQMPAALSEWSLKYGPMKPGAPHSGFTPAGLLAPTLGTPVPTTVDRAVRENFQKEKLKSFTTTELAQLDCLPTRELIPGNLAISIIPLLQRHAWEIRPLKPDFTRDNLYPLSNGNGMWTAANDVVWNIMQPPLQIASTMLMSSHLLPWFDALFFGRRAQVPNERIKDEDRCDRDGDVIDLDDMQSFWRRENNVFDPVATAAARDRVFLLLQQQYSYLFGFMNPHVEHPSGPDQDADEALGAHALTITNRFFMKFNTTVPNKTWKVFTFLDIDLPEMLLRTDLNSAERMQIQWLIGNTLAHEVIHAIDYLETDFKDNPDKFEPYFEDEPIAELGFSYENAINIGQTEAMIVGDHANAVPPLGFWLRKYWPDVTDASLAQEMQPILRDPGPSHMNEIYPIPLSFYQDIQQEDFWNVAVMNFGTKLLQYRASKVGVRYTYRAKDNRSYACRTRERFTPILHPFSILNGQFRVSVDAINAAIQTTPEQRTAMEFGRGILASSTLEDRFWTDSQAQEQEIQKIADSMNTATHILPTPGKRLAFSQVIHGMIKHALENHENMIQTISSLEVVNKTTFPDRRRILREWNRGTRIFLRRLDSHLRQAGLDAEQELIRLEQARMVLWNPFDLATQDGADWREFELMQMVENCQLPNDFLLMKALCDTILAAPDLSIFGESCARIYLFEREKGVLGGTNDSWVERYEEVQLVHGRLLQLTKTPPEKWKVMMRDMRELCKAAIEFAMPLPLSTLPDNDAGDMDLS